MRALEIFVDPSTVWSAGQQSWFRIVDVLITGALVGGGADGLHKIVSIFTDFADSTRGRVAGNAPSVAPAPAAAALEAGTVHPQFTLTRDFPLGQETHAAPVILGDI